ncbi:hypothetical protein [Aquitalea aquatica]|uniref:Uncharacterized protein n=1 Tax=Aquitalea aquatica TaxID=3044273 RepID=A0A838Y2P0_9NEIS|nr:hypothetical protein [Aquitalea magnusonii]MBA4707552.1 hypothetical protein [Aquitalea magnusonii]
MSNEKMRAEFEAWVDAKTTLKPEKDADGFYVDMDVYTWWKVWQAARAQPAEYDTMRLAEMVLSDCGCSTAISDRLQRRVAERIQRHIDGLQPVQPAGEAVAQKPVGEIGAYGPVWFSQKISDLPVGTKVYAAPPAQVPDGWQLVPKEATQSMIDAMPPVEEIGYWAMYEAALAAAPQPKGDKK